MLCEVLDLRYGGQLARLHILRERLRDYLAGRTAKIAELAPETAQFLG